MKARHVLLSLLLAAPFALAAQNKPKDDDTLRVSTRLVNVFVNVTDEHGGIIGTLGKGDFRISEDGDPQTVAIFERETSAPLTLSLALDTSGSVRRDLPEEIHAAKKFTKAILRKQDRMSLYEFQTDVRKVVPFTNSASRIDEGLGSLEKGPATALYDAIYLASESLAKYDGRKVLVLVTDGGNTVKGVSFQTALDAAERANVMIYSLIDVPIEASAGRDLGGEHALITLSEQTGGRYYYVGDEGLEKSFNRLSEDLRTQYLLGYYPQHRRQQAGFRHISVALSGGQTYTLRYRAGYFADHGGTQ